MKYLEHYIDNTTPLTQKCKNILTHLDPTNLFRLKSPSYALHNVCYDLTDWFFNLFRSPHGASRLPFVIVFVEYRSADDIFYLDESAVMTGQKKSASCYMEIQKPDR